MSESEIIQVGRASLEPSSEFEESYTDEIDEKTQILSAVFAEPLGNVGRRKILALPGKTSVFDAIRAMNHRHVGCALVVDDGKLVGIFTERDVLTKIAAEGVDVVTATIAESMTPDPETLPASASVAFALRKIRLEGYRHIPLVDGDQRVVGVVSVRDIVGWICDLFPSNILNLPPEPGYPKSVDGG